MRFREAHRHLVTLLLRQRSFKGTSPQGAAATCARDASRVRKWGAYGCSHRWAARR
jgi:hypothetical protein